jgi:hypothetical protein
MPEAESSLASRIEQVADSPVSNVIAASRRELDL